MAMSWVEAVKAYCAKHGCKYKVPRKGSPEYEEVKKMMGGGAAPPDEKAAPKEEGTKKGEERKTARKAFEGLEKKRAPKAKKEDAAVAVGGVVAKVKDGAVKHKAAPRKRAPKKEGDVAVLSEAAGVPLSKPRRKRGSRLEANASQVAKSEGITERAAERSANPEVLLNNATNVHDPIAPPAALAGDLKELKAEVAKVRKPRALPKLVEPEHVVNAPAFDFLAFKRKIGA